MRTRLTGTLLWYWAICKRQAWLMAHGINPNEEHPHLELGRFLSQRAYPRLGRREILLSGMRIDLLQPGQGRRVVVAEVKKSSRFLEAARLQLLYYLYRLEAEGVAARGELRIPLERRRIPVELDETGRRQVEEAMAGLQDLLERPKPPPAVRIPFCRPCAYQEFCWASLGPEAVLDEA